MTTKIDLCERVLALEAKIEAQSKLNEELWRWFESDCSDPISESLCAAFAAALDKKAAE